MYSSIDTTCNSDIDEMPYLSLIPYSSQNLYDAMDPDKDTLTTRQQLGRKELLDTEHQLLLLVERLLDKANYFQVRGLLSASYAMYDLL